MITASSLSDRVGFVVIGRNEGPRLEQCLRSLLPISTNIVYADSASGDASVDLARQLGVATIVLDESEPLTAARGRNAGFKAFADRFPECALVQFIDGDCVLAPTWIKRAAAFLDSHPLAAVACGRRYEAKPHVSPYNRLCDEEWDTPVGMAEACGGDALVRVEAFIQVGGFRSELKAGEEPEMTARMRAAGWEIWRLDEPMTEHDARLLRFGQWWRRNLRAGFGYAQVWSTTSNLPKRLFARQLQSAFFWILGLPTILCFGALVLRAPVLVLLLPILYAVQLARMAARRGVASAWSWRASALILLVKVPETIGALTYFVGAGPDRVSDYKAPAT